MNPTLPSLLATAVAAALPLAAQTQVTLPTNADVAEGHHSVGLPFGAPGFRTQLLVDSDAIALTGAVLTGIRFRADRLSAPQAATVVPNVTIKLSHTSVTLGNLVDTFANNITGVETVVFQGSVTLPATQDTGLSGAAAWDIVIPFAQPYVYTGAMGELLIDIVGNNAASMFPSYWLDAMQRGGSAAPFGRGGSNPSQDNLNLIVSTGNSLEPRLLSIGNTIDFTSTLSFTSPPGVLVLGTFAYPTPIDLGQLGAPTNTLYVDPIVLVPHAWTQSFIGWFSTFQLMVPNVPTLADVVVYGQGALLEPTANPLGLVLGPAMEVRIGDPLLSFPLQQVDANDPAALVGTVLDFGFGQPEYGATPIRLEGTFF